MGSLIWMSIFATVVLSSIPDTLAGPFSNADTIFKPWKVRTSTSYRFDKKPSLKKVPKVSYNSPPAVFRTAAHQSNPVQSNRDQVADPIDWSAADMMQRPIDEPESRQVSYHKLAFRTDFELILFQTDRVLGSPCTYSSDCSSACCLLDRYTKVRSCQPKGRMSDRCSNFQVKGDLYVDACPCARGTNHCSTKTKRCS